MQILFIVGRILFGGYFILSGYNHFKNFKGLTGYAQSKKAPMPQASVVVSGILLFLGGFSMLLGIVPRLGSLVLIVCLVAITFVMHPFWKETDGMQKMTEKVQFQKNIALVGALMMIAMLPIPWNTLFN